jgi:hypothetical protein
LEVPDGVGGLVRDALQEILDCWNGIFDVVEEMGIDFCFVVSLSESRM